MKVGVLLGLAGFPLFAARAQNANGGDAGKGRIVILGDSITAGYGLDPAEAYPALVQEKVAAAGLAYKVVNAGVSGDTTSGGLRRINWAMGPGAEVLVIALGGNDGLRGIPPEQTAENLKGIIGKAREKSPGVRILVAGMRMPDNMGPEYTTKFSRLFADTAAANQAVSIPFLLQDVGGIESLNQADQIHPNAEGQKKVAENVWKVLEGVLMRRENAVAP